MNIGKSRIECGPVSFALQYRELDGGAPHSQGAGGPGGSHADQGVCVNHPHYHYGPRAKNERIFLDTTLIPDALRWTLDQFKHAKLPVMLERAGYPTIAAALDADLIAVTLPEVQARLQAMMQADPR